MITTKSGLPKYIDSGSFRYFLTKEIGIHNGHLRGKSGKSPEWEKGFVEGLKQAITCLDLQREVEQEIQEP